MQINFRKEKNMEKVKIYGKNYSELAELLKKEREVGKTVVMASGTFDLFHVGHMRMLAAAKNMGDILVVVVKSDRAAALKKKDPPVLDEKTRMETIANCISADYVVMADYDPCRLVQFPFENVRSFEWLNMFVPVVRKIKPDIFVHEDNATIANARRVLFEEYNVSGVIQPRTEGISTTDIIDRIRTRLLLEMQK